MRPWFLLLMIWFGELVLRHFPVDFLRVPPNLVHLGLFRHIVLPGLGALRGRGPGSRPLPTALPPPCPEVAAPLRKCFPLCSAKPWARVTHHPASEWQHQLGCDRLSLRGAERGALMIPSPGPRHPEDPAAWCFAGGMPGCQLCPQVFPGPAQPCRVPGSPRLWQTQRRGLCGDRGSGQASLSPVPLTCAPGPARASLLDSSLLGANSLPTYDLETWWHLKPTGKTARAWQTRACSAGPTRLPSCPPASPAAGCDPGGICERPTMPLILGSQGWHVSPLACPPGGPGEEGAGGSGSSWAELGWSGLVLLPQLVLSPKPGFLNFFNPFFLPFYFFWLIFHPGKILSRFTFFLKNCKTVLCLQDSLPA